MIVQCRWLPHIHAHGTEQARQRAIYRQERTFLIEEIFDKIGAVTSNTRVRRYLLVLSSFIFIYRIKITGIKRQSRIRDDGRKKKVLDAPVPEKRLPAAT